MSELYSNYLEHHGILGQKWGVRRYQNADGSLTDAGRKRYGVEGSEKTGKQYTKRLNDLDQAIAFNTRDYRENEAVANRLYRKSAKKKAKGKELSKREQKALDKATERMNKASEYINKGYEETAKILLSIDKDEFNVKAAKTMRNVKRGEEYVAEVIAAGLGGFMLPALGAPMGIITVTGKYADGYEYTVKEKSKKQKERERNNK